ncbi:MAG: RES family NAD+ phosphorylase [Opitutaceae bacterium]|jgi:hypothetical protein
MKSAEELAAILPGLPPTAIERTFARRVLLTSLLGLKTPLGTAGETLAISYPRFLWTSRSEYRYNPPGIEALYLGEGESIAGAETKQNPGLNGFDVEPADPGVIFHVEVQASAILDVTKPDIQAELGTDEAELVAPWRLKRPAAPTQLLGQAVYNCGLFEGIRYHSAPMAKVGAEGYCVVLFRAKRLSTSIVRLFAKSGIWEEQW